VKIDRGVVRTIVPGIGTGVVFSVWRILDHYVERARQAQDLSKVSALGIDETSRRKGHQYVTTFCDLDERRVLFVTEGKGAETVKAFVEDFKERGAAPERISEVCTDMSGAFIKGVAKHLPGAEVTFGRYHVMALLNAAVDEVRRLETKGNAVLKHSRYLFLKNAANLNAKQTAKLETLKGLDLKTVRAYHLKVALQRLWAYKRRDFAEAYLKRWFFWATHSRLKPMRDVAYAIKRHWEGILRFIKSRVTNGITEGLNAKIKEAAKRAGCGSFGTTARSAFSLRSGL
jgi:transposase